MTELTTISDINNVLAKYIPLASEITGKDITLDRMRLLMAALGNPEKKLKIIHIAGTSGKTSTTYYITSLLAASGKKVGMTVSPHVDSVTERVQINMQPISVEDFGRVLAEFLAIIDKANVEPTYFELLVAFAYWYFAEQGVDYAVVETGMGGLQDGTNVAERPDKVCVITDIGYDHMHVLGNTLAEIAAQKAGIIQQGNDVYVYGQSDEVMTAINERCKLKSVKIHLVDKIYSKNELLVSLPEFQKRNWNLAYQVYLTLKQRDNLDDLGEDNLKMSLKVQVPARMDVRLLQDKTLIMDGAHNGQKMQAFVDSFKHRYPGHKATVLLSLKSNKDYMEVLPILSAVTKTLIITTFALSQDMPLRSVPAEELANAAKQFNFSEVITEPDQQKAYEILQNHPSELKIITGSFYLISQLRNNNQELKSAS